MRDRLTKYKANRISGMSQYNAARAAGYSEKYSKQACRIDKLVKDSIIDALEQAGLTDKYQSEELHKLTQCKSSVVRIRVWEHIAKLKNQLVEKPLIDQSQHTHITYTRKGSDERIGSRDPLQAPVLPG